MPVPEHLAAAPCEHGVELDMCDTYGCTQDYNRLAEEHATTTGDPMTSGKNLADQLAHARAEKAKWTAEVVRLEEMAASDQCLYMHEEWDGPYRMSGRCTQPAGHTDSAWKWDHGPWKGLSDEARTELVELQKAARERADR